MRYLIVLGSVVCLTAAMTGQVSKATAQTETAVAQTATRPNEKTSVTEESVTNPVADQRAMVTLGHARFTVLTPQLIRMEWAADGVFEDRASLVFINRRLPVPRFQKSLANSGRKLLVKTSALTLAYTPTGDGRFTADNLSIELTVDVKSVVWHPTLNDTKNLLGTTRTLDGVLGDKIREPIEPGLVSRSGWSLVDDSSRPLFDSVDFRFNEGENSSWPWVMPRTTSERQDWYFFGYGHDYRKALGDYVRVAGRIPLPPPFAFGTWWSRWWAYSDQQINQIVRSFRENDVPLDVFVIDMDWHISGDQLRAQGQVDQSGHDLGWTGFTWNKLLFPEPEQLLADLHAAGLKTVLNLHPASGIQPWESAYAQMAMAMGINPAANKYVPFDITEKKFATNYLNLVLHPLEKQGVDFWWLDWQQEANTKIPGVTPTWWLNYVHFSDQQREGKRPLLFHRWGGLGNHRYQIGFSGDTVSAWESLAFQPWFTATAANVGYAYWSHDIGGFRSRSVDPELFTRWVEFGVFSPILRTHATKNSANERRIWAYPEPYSSILRSAFQLRYTLQPYIYTEARRTYDSGIAFVRPLYYDWPEEESAYTIKGEYAFGDEMIVAPVTTAGDKAVGLAAVNLWLPPGEWIEWPTGKHVTGPATLQRAFSIEQTPVYLKAGAIVPMQPPMHYTGEKPVDPLIVSVWPLEPGARSNYVVYEDSGIGIEYQKGSFVRTPIQAAQTGDELRVEIGPAYGSYSGMPKMRSYELRLPADWPPSEVTVDNKPIGQCANGIKKECWSFDGNTLTTIIPIPSKTVEAGVSVMVRRPDGLMERRAELDGFAGAMTRLSSAYDAMQEIPPIAGVPDSLVEAMQAGDRLGYHPERAAEELAKFHEILSKTQSDLLAIGPSIGTRFDDYTKNHRFPPGLDLAAARRTRIDAMTRAQKLVYEAER